MAVLPGLLPGSLDAQAPGTARVGVLSSTGPTVNLQAARAIQLALPQSLLARADHVIE